MLIKKPFLVIFRLFFLNEEENIPIPPWKKQKINNNTNKWSLTCSRLSHHKTNTPKLYFRSPQRNQNTPNFPSLPQNETKTLLVTFESIGGSTCLIINWGDLSLTSYGDFYTCTTENMEIPYEPGTPLDISMNVTHVYW